MKSLETLQAEKDLIIQQLNDNDQDLSTKKIIELSNELSAIDRAIDTLSVVKVSVKKK